MPTASACSPSRIVARRTGGVLARDEAELVLAGFLSFADPVLPDAADTLAQLKTDGVQVKILTGDGDVVARHVCRRSVSATRPS